MSNLRVRSRDDVIRRESLLASAEKCCHEPAQGPAQESNRARVGPGAASVSFCKRSLCRLDKSLCCGVGSVSESGKSFCKSRERDWT